MIRRVLYESVGSLRAYLRRLNPPGLDSRPLRINYGCGLLAQPGYVGVDVRWTPAVEVIGDLSWCRRAYAGKADEVYCSHVLEHYRYPGKEWGDIVLSHLLIYDVPSYSDAIDNIEKKYERLSANWMVCGLFCMYFFCGL